MQVYPFLCMYVGMFINLCMDRYMSVSVLSPTSLIKGQLCSHYDLYTNIHINICMGMYRYFSTKIHYDERAIVFASYHVPIFTCKHMCGHIHMFICIQIHI